MSQSIKNDVKTNFERFLRRKYYLLLQLGIKTGLRIGDLLSITTSQLKMGRFTITEEKTGAKRRIYIPVGLRGPLSAIAGRKFIWQSTSSRRIGKPMTRQAVWYAFKKALKDAGVSDNISPHSMRKTFAEIDYLKSKDLKKLQKKLAHTNPMTTLIYIMGLLD